MQDFFFLSFFFTGAKAMTNSTHFFIDFAYQIFGNDFPMISSIEMSEKSLMKEENALITATKQCDVSSLGKS